jgi:hypothetical protein
MLRNDACAKKSSNTKISLPVWPTCSQKHMIPGRELQYTNLHTIDSFQTCMFHTQNLHLYLLSIYWLHPSSKRHCDAPRKWAKSLVSLCSKVMWSPLNKYFQHHYKRIHLGNHHATHHVFPILDVEYLSSLWMSFKD